MKLRLQALYGYNPPDTGGVPPEQVHGTRNCYSAGCRCTECKTACADYRQAIRLMKYADHHGLTPDQVEHLVTERKKQQEASAQHRNFINIRWTDEAACLGAPTHHWFPGLGESSLPEYRNARLVCYECPVQNECLIYALRGHERYGLWGGVPDRERQPLEQVNEAHAIEVAQRIRDAWYQKTINPPPRRRR